MVLVVASQGKYGNDAYKSAIDPTAKGDGRHFFQTPICDDTKLGIYPAPAAGSIEDLVPQQAKKMALDKVRIGSPSNPDDGPYTFVLVG